MSTNYIIPTYEQALELTTDVYSESYYGIVKIQAKSVAKSLATNGFHIRNASGAKLPRYTLHWVDKDGTLRSTDRITMARVSHLMDWLKGELDLPADVVDNLMHNGFNGLRAVRRIKKNKFNQELEELIKKIKKTAVSHMICTDTGKAAHDYRVSIR